MELQMRRNRHHRERGITLAELSVAMAFCLPLIIGMLYAWLEASLLFTIRTNLDVATRRAAQLLINNYATNGTATNTTNGNLPSGLAFDVQTGNGMYFIKHDANQFTWTWDLTDRPATITVTTSFPTDGSNGLAPFPSPDPLHVRNSIKTIITSATFPVPAPN